MLLRFALASLLCCSTSLLLAAEPSPAAPALPWFTNYSEACSAAKTAGQMLLIVFEDERHPEVYDEYLRSLEANERFAKVSTHAVLCKLPTNTEVKLASDKEGEEGAKIQLLAYPAFTELGRRPGLAVIDYAHTKSKHYGHVVNIYPFKTRFLAGERVALMIDLPEGSLTQRSMIFAVLTHPERPASAQGEFTPTLAEESENHSRHQANIRVQGHHQWESRFHRINARLGRGLVAQEVVAESWPGQDLMEACEECVHSWRQSSGHWEAVRGRQKVFAFDIKRGGNGIWYATGLFGR
jgi:hypothetical protein